MEILFVSHKYPPTIGGMEKQSYELIRCASKAHKVHKVILDKSQESVVTFFRKLKPRVAQVLRENPSIELIHLNDGLMGYFSLWLKKYTDIPVVLTFHGLDVVFPNPYFQNKILPKFLGFDAFVCVSEATRQAALMRGFPAERTYTVPNGVDHDLASMQVDEEALRDKMARQYHIDLKGRKIIAALGRPVRRKGFSWFLDEVLPHLDDEVLFLMIGPRSMKKGPPLWKRLLPSKWVGEIELFLGDTNDEAIIAQRVQSPDIRGKVLQTGSIPFADVMGLLGMADLFVMPNIRVEGDAEGFGLVALEASLRQTPVLASGIEGITEAIHEGRNGHLLPSGDAPAWIRRIGEELSQPALLEAKGRRFQQYTLDTFAWDTMVEGYLEVFGEVLRVQERSKHK